MNIKNETYLYWFKLTIQWEKNGKSSKNNYNAVFISHEKNKEEVSKLSKQIAMLANFVVIEKFKIPETIIDVKVTRIDVGYWHYDNNIKLDELFTSEGIPDIEDDNCDVHEYN